jgi:hypothetical protein
MFINRRSKGTTPNSKDDAYLRLVLVHGYFNNTVSRAHFNTKIVRAMTQKPAMLIALYGNKTLVTVDGEPRTAVDIDVARFNNALEHVCR